MHKLFQKGFLRMWKSGCPWEAELETGIWWKDLFSLHALCTVCIVFTASKDCIFNVTAM